MNGSTLTTDEKQIVALQAERYRPGFGYAFAFGRAYLDAITDEEKVCILLRDSKTWKKKVSPEVALADYRGELSAEGIQRALGDLMHWFLCNGYNYLNLLENAPQDIATILWKSVGEIGVKR